MNDAFYNQGPDECNAQYDAVEQKRTYWVEHCYREEYGVYYCDDGELIKTAFKGTKSECRTWIKNQKKP